MTYCKACGSVEGFEQKGAQLYCKNCGRTEKAAIEHLQVQKQKRRARFTKYVLIFFGAAFFVSLFLFLFVQHPARFERLAIELVAKGILIAVLFAVGFAIYVWWIRRK